MEILGKGETEFKVIVRAHGKEETYTFNTKKELESFYNFFKDHFPHIEIIVVEQPGKT